ncbi:MAG: CpsD/CapB family tyrosine-protein kinase [Phycisphaerae bacterium]|nr:CpsD/CapB family tyrosine-protein kinase [Phycisphaerae bacterium]
MGRIADALKRAEQERAQRMSQHSSDDPRLSTDYSTAVDAINNVELIGPDTDAVARVEQISQTLSALSANVASSSTASMPTSQPFIVTAEPISSEFVAPEVIAFHEPDSPMAERYRSARTRLLAGNKNSHPRIFALTSSLRGEGKTLTVSNLGFSLAELRHLRIAMIDCDFRKPGLSQSFDAGDKLGLAEFLRGECQLSDICVPVVRDNLFLVPAGNLGSSHPSELLTGASAIAAFRAINERFHYGLIDTPPTDTTADIGMIAPLCHSVVIVIRMNRTPEHVVRRSVRILQANRVEIAGSLLVGYCEKIMSYTDTYDYYETRT